MSIAAKPPRHVGIVIRHRKDCERDGGASCLCGPGFQAQVYSACDQRTIRKTFPTLAAAKAWRADASVALRNGTMRAPSKITLREAAAAWVEGARSGAIRNRSGDPYKPAAVRGYEMALRLRLLPQLGSRRITNIDRHDVQLFIDRSLAKGANPATLRNTLMPLRAIYRRALIRGEVVINPTSGLELPAARGRRERIASPAEAAILIKALPESDRAIWATATYAGLRLGELLALDWEDIDLELGVIRVHRAWDQYAGLIAPKSRAGTRAVPIPTILRDHLEQHRDGQRRGGRGLVFGSTPDRPPSPKAMHGRARRTWQAAGLAPILPHECRHTYASMMIAAGVNAKALSTYMGHAAISITLDRYGHLMPGSETESAQRLDAYLNGAANFAGDGD